MDDKDPFQFKLQRLSQALEFEVPSPEALVKTGSPYEEIRELLAKAISLLLEEDFPRLQSILYRIDISENCTREALEEKDTRSRAQSLAEAIIKRHLKKLESRRAYWREKERESSPQIPPEK